MIEHVGVLTIDGQKQENTVEPLKLKSDQTNSCLKAVPSVVIRRQKRNSIHKQVVAKDRYIQEVVAQIQGVGLHLC